MGLVNSTLVEIQPIKRVLTGCISTSVLVAINLDRLYNEITSSAAVSYPYSQP